LPERIKLYRQLERKRGHPVIVYVTSRRRNGAGEIATDAVPEVHAQLQALPDSAAELDLYLVSNGGDGTVAWRIVSLIRERVKKFAVLVPEGAFSAATLIALGADEIVMHPNGNLGPTDPQIISPGERRKDGTSGQVKFGYEDLAAFLSFAEEQVGINDQSLKLEVFKQFCNEVGSLTIGIAARSSQLTVNMGEQLLGLHMKDEQKRKARTISEALNKKFFHHGYPVSRNEAKEIGLKLAKPDPSVEATMWAIWQDIAEELQLREPFLPLALLADDPRFASLFGPVPQVSIPNGIPPQLMQQVLANVLQSVPVVQVPPKPYQLIHALMESPRLNSRYVSEGVIIANRQPDLKVSIALLQQKASWRDAFSGPAKKGEGEPHVEAQDEKAFAGEVPPGGGAEDVPPEVAEPNQVPSEANEAGTKPAKKTKRTRGGSRKPENPRTPSRPKKKAKRKKPTAKRSTE